VLGDVGEPAQGFDVAGPHQSGLNTHGQVLSRTPVEKLPHGYVSFVVPYRREDNAYLGGSGRPHSSIELKHSPWFHRNDGGGIPYVERPRTHAVVNPRPDRRPARIHISHMGSTHHPQRVQPAVREDREDPLSAGRHRLAYFYHFCSLLRVRD